MVGVDCCGAVMRLAACASVFESVCGVRGSVCGKCLPACVCRHVMYRIRALSMSGGIARDMSIAAVRHMPICKHMPGMVIVSHSSRGGGCLRVCLCGDLLC